MSCVFYLRAVATSFERCRVECFAYGRRSPMGDLYWKTPFQDVIWEMSFKDVIQETSFGRRYLGMSFRTRHLGEACFTRRLCAPSFSLRYRNSLSTTHHGGGMAVEYWTAGCRRGCEAERVRAEQGNVEVGRCRGARCSDLEVYESLSDPESFVSYPSMILMGSYK